MSRYPVHITQIALLTPLDSPPTDTWTALCAGQSLCDRGIVDDALLAETPATLDRATRLAIAVTKRLQLDSAAPPPLFVGTSKGPILSQLAALDSRRAGRPLTQEQARAIAYGPHAIATDLTKHLGLRTGHSPHTSVAACSSGLHAFHRAVRAIEFGEIDSALIVAADASHHPLFEASFDRLGVLSKPDPPPGDGHRRCRPFDPSGNGFFLTEAAAAILLRRGNGALTVAHSTIAADATALVALDPQSVALRAALVSSVQSSVFRRTKDSGPRTQDLSFIHAHATGTAHDALELAALRAVFGPPPHAIPILASKSQLGHSLGAAGLVSLALSALSHQRQQTWTGLPVPQSTRSVTLSQGFGGHIAVVTLAGGDGKVQCEM